MTSSLVSAATLGPLEWLSLSKDKISSSTVYTVKTWALRLYIDETDAGGIGAPYSFTVYPILTLRFMCRQPSVECRGNCQRWCSFVLCHPVLPACLLSYHIFSSSWPVEKFQAERVCKYNSLRTLTWSAMMTSKWILQMIQLPRLSSRSLRATFQKIMIDRSRIWLLYYNVCE